MSNERVSFASFKEVFSFYDANENHFTDSVVYGCNEENFEQWLNIQPPVQRLCSCYTPLHELKLTVKRWKFLELHYIRQMESNFLVATFPEGFFETFNEKTGVAACFLPDTYGRKPFRVSIYDEFGPRYHETFDNRRDALLYLARQKYRPKPGIIDTLMQKSTWDQGLWVCKWIGEGLSSAEGIKRDMQIPEVRKLFHSTISELEKMPERLNPKGIETGENMKFHDICKAKTCPKCGNTLKLKSEEEVYCAFSVTIRSFDCEKCGFHACDDFNCTRCKSAN